MQKVREAANRTKCENNLKQLALGLQMFANEQGYFPPAIRNDVNYATDAPGYVPDTYEPGWGWGTLILPYVEQGNLYHELNPDVQIFGGGANPANPTTLTQMVLPIFRCPSDPAPDLNAARLNFGMSNYRATSGNNENNGLMPSNDTYFDWGGVCYYNSKTKHEQITDGESVTCVIGECIYEPTPDLTAGKWAAIWAGHTGIYGGGIRISDNQWTLDADTATINGTAPQAFGSRHGNGALFAFADGSVRYIKTGGDPSNLMYMAGRNDNIQVDFD